MCQYANARCSIAAVGGFLCGYITTPSDHANDSVTCDPANGKMQIAIANPERP